MWSSYFYLLLNLFLIAELVIAEHFTFGKNWQNCWENCRLNFTNFCQLNFTKP